MNLVGTSCDYVDWIHLAQKRIQWRALVNTVMILWTRRATSWPAGWLSASQNGLYSMELVT